MNSGHISENKRLTARERWLMKHKEIRLYLELDEYQLLESLASEEGLTVRDFILKLAKDLKQLEAESSILAKIGVSCKPSRVAECVSGLKEKLILQQLEYAICMEQREKLLAYNEILKILSLLKKL
jgi:uncharacterized protein (DUF1778 family)